LDGPASAARHAERQSQMHDLAARVRSLWRSGSGCAAGHEARPARQPADGPRLRAVALPDEVLALMSDGDRVEAKRWTVDRATLRALLDDFAAGRLDVETWRRDAAPLVEVLTVGLDPTLQVGTDGSADIVFSLHGMLQDVPLVALPWGDGWLGASWVPLVQPAEGGDAVGRRWAEDSAPSDGPLVVVDPTRDLPAAAAAVEDWRRDFPTARLLSGDSASREAVVAGLKTATWLHVDAHGTYDPAFPELSGLRLADRPLRVVELAEDRAALDPSLAFVHLSGCQTGRWPITADSGAYGLAGLFSRSGVPWVVASRYDLPDDLAAAFNRRFYAAVADGGGVPEAFRQGLASIAEMQPPSAWGGLMLLRTGRQLGRSATRPGQSGGRSTPPQGATPNTRSSSAEEIP
ncbi:MAG: CHAT domain-containing protein, partial [Acidobacteriota bacterium]